MLSFRLWPWANSFQRFHITHLPTTWKQSFVCKVLQSVFPSDIVNCISAQRCVKSNRCFWKTFWMEQLRLINRRTCVSDSSNLNSIEINQFFCQQIHLVWCLFASEHTVSLYMGNRRNHALCTKGQIFVCERMREQICWIRLEFGLNQFTVVSLNPNSVDSI